MLANGHPLAASYPLAVLADEAEIVVERTNAHHAMFGTIVHSAASAVLVKGGHEHFRKLIKQLTGE